MPMDVAVPHMPGQSRLREKIPISIAGDSFLERARSTTFALLGMIVAVGLAIVALAMHQEWPVVGGSAIPGAPGESGTVHIAGGVALGGSEGVSQPIETSAAGLGSGATADGSGSKGSGANARRESRPAQGVGNSDSLVSAPSEPPVPASPEPETAAEPVAPEPPASPAPEPSRGSNASTPSPVKTAASTGPKVVSVAGHRGGSGSEASPGKSASRGRGSEQSGTPPTPAPEGIELPSSEADPAAGPGNSDWGHGQGGGSGQGHGPGGAHGHSGH